MGFVGQRSRSQLLKIEQQFDTFSFPHVYLKNRMLDLYKLGTHMPDGERSKPIDIEDRKTKVKVTTTKNRTKI